MVDVHEVFLPALRAQAADIRNTYASHAQRAATVRERDEWNRRAKTSDPERQAEAIAQSAKLTKSLRAMPQSNRCLRRAWARAAWKADRMVDAFARSTA